jgi:hypothetical protein
MLLYFAHVLSVCAAVLWCASVGAEKQNIERGSMYLYSRNVAGGVTTPSEQWQLLGQTAGTPLSNSLFGSALALSDSTMEIVIGGQLEHTPGSRAATHMTAESISVSFF